MILGIDPGERTGVAVVRVDSQAPFRVGDAHAMPARLFPQWARHLLQTQCIDAFAIEEWQFYGGPRGRKGTAQAAFAVGRTIGALEGLGMTRWVGVPRPAVLRALGLPGNASKDRCRRVTQALTDLGGTHPDHVWDAIAVAIAGAGELHTRELAKGASA